MAAEFDRYMKLRDAISYDMWMVSKCLPSMKRTRSKWDKRYIFHHLHKALKGMIQMIEFVRDLNIRIEERHNLLELLMELNDALDNSFRSLICIPEVDPEYKQLKHFHKNIQPWGMMMRDLCIAIQDAFTYTSDSYREDESLPTLEDMGITITPPTLDNMGITIQFNTQESAR